MASPDGVDDGLNSLGVQTGENPGRRGMRQQIQEAEDADDHGRDHQGSMPVMKAKMLDHRTGGRSAHHQAKKVPRSRNLEGVLERLYEAWGP